MCPTLKENNINRSSHKRCSIKKGLLKSFANFIGKHLWWSFFLRKLQVFSCEICEILSTPILKNICERLLLCKVLNQIKYVSLFALVFYYFSLHISCNKQPSIALFMSKQTQPVIEVENHN